MKTSSPKQKKAINFKTLSNNRVKKKKSRESSICLLQKLSNGTSNWDQLSKVLGNAVMSGKKKGNSPSLKPQVGKKDLTKVRTMANSSPVLGGSKTVPTSLTRKSTVIRDIGNAVEVKSSRVSQNTFVKDKIRQNAVTDEAGPARVQFPRGKQFHSNENRMPPSNIKKEIPANQPQGSTLGDRPRLTKHVAMDCEMVGTGENGTDSMIARVSIVNRYGDCLYDAYVAPKDDITDYRTHVSGIRPSDLKKGKDLFTVQQEVLAILEGRILVGHALKNDLDVLFIGHPKSMIRDTARYKPFRQAFEGRTPSLKNLSAKLLGKEIQSGEHNSVEDAQAAMQLYLMHRSDWEKSLKFRRKKMLRNKNREEEEEQ